MTFQTLAVAGNLAGTRTQVSQARSMPRCDSNLNILLDNGQLLRIRWQRTLSSLGMESKTWAEEGLRRWQVGKEDRCLSPVFSAASCAWPCCRPPHHFNLGRVAINRSLSPPSVSGSLLRGET